MSDEEIALFAERIGFKLINPRNWTFATPEIYLSDLHDRFNFASLSHFSRYVQNNLGASPSSFRE